MPTTKQQPKPSGPTLVVPGERAVLLSHREYQLARAQGNGLDGYDLVMRNPEDADAAGQPLSEEDRWQPIPAVKYLKHRAMEWREAASLDELPTQWQELAQGRDPFPQAGD
ncbi:MAG: hypothetical protein OXH38_02340 [Chloroflexi bacterium]|nr:hypothetical protein [Chloroflexota bacterium]